MDEGTQFGLLGPLLVRYDGVTVPVPPGKQRALLAALLLNANQPVPVDQPAEVLWGPAPPPSARPSLQNFVMRLRRSLAATGPARIIAQPDGYLIRIQAGELDVDQFELALAVTREHARSGSWAEAAAVLRPALALWRGPPLSDVRSDALALREVPWLAELRLQALETRIDADLHTGRHAEVIAELERLAALHPLRERLHALLMLALYRDGRGAEALAAYQRARLVLAGELGTEPAAELRELHQQILTGAAAPAVTPPGPPRELPGPVRHFVGREEELRELTRLLDGAGERAPAAVLISAIGGTAGVGKTALAVYWAHRVATRFPDGQLYVNLRGYDPGEPVPAADALSGFLRALGVSGPDIPADPGERAARFRSLMAGRRMLVLLDNASQAEQVRPLLPGSPGCVAMVTSRDTLAGLVARDGAQRLDLDLLPAADAVGLLRELIGARVDADPDGAAALADRCARLPLALRVAAELAAAHPATGLAGLAGELADHQQALDLLTAGADQQTGIRAVFSWSCQHLDTEAARTFRLAGLHPGPDLDACAMAALADSTAGRARRLLEVLAGAQLISRTGPGRYGMHDLLSAYARELVAARDSQADRRAALTRLLDYYLQASAAAMDTLFPAEARRRPRIPGTTVRARPGTDHPAAARAWLDAELASLVAVAAQAAANGWPGHATLLSAILFQYLDVGGHYPEAAVIHGHARSAAAQLSDRAAEADALTSLGLVALHQGRYQQAAGHLRQALKLSCEISDRDRQARAQHNLGLTDFQQGHWQRASRQLEQALSLFRATGDRIGEARVLGNLAIIESHYQRFAPATEYLQRALAIYREARHPTGEAYVLANLNAG